MKSILEYMGSREVKNNKLNKLLKNCGLETIKLFKSNGYFYISSDDEKTLEELNKLQSTAIYTNSFNQQSPEDWVEEIKYLLKDTNLLNYE